MMKSFVINKGNLPTRVVLPAAGKPRKKSKSKMLVVYSNRISDSFLNLKAWVRIVFIFGLNDSPSKTMKNAFYFIYKGLIVLEIFKYL